MSLILLGFLSSIVSEFVTYLNKKLTGTLLADRGAFIISVGISFIAGIYKVSTTGGFDVHNWASILTTFGSIYVFAQIFFDYFIKKFNLAVK